MNTFWVFRFTSRPPFQRRDRVGRQRQARARLCIAAVVPPVRGAASTPGFGRSASEPPPFQLAAEAQNCAVFNTRERLGAWPNHLRASKLFIFADGYLTIHDHYTCKSFQIQPLTHIFFDIFGLSVKFVSFTLLHLNIFYNICNVYETIVNIFFQFSLSPILDQGATPLQNC